MRTIALLILLFLVPCAWAQPTREPRRTPIVEAVEKVRSTVVNISTEQVVMMRRGLDGFGPGDPTDRFFDDFFRQPSYERKTVNTPLGSGALITADGLVITNEHVIRRATSIKLSLDTGETFDAVLLAADPNEDLALLRAKLDKPRAAIPMGTSSDLMLGETVIALGNPFGFVNSVTSGIVSAFDRQIEVGQGEEAVRYTGLIQTSALINPGNSGGPLVNVLGELIGINAAVVDQAQGIGFAIPIDRARDVLAPMLATPQVSEAWLGVRGATVEGRKGVKVVDLEKGSPGEARLKVDDVITEIDGQPAGDLFSFLLRLVQHKPGDAIALKVQQQDRSATVKVTLGNMPQPSPDEILRDKFGVAGQNLTLSGRRQGTPAGVVLTDVQRNGPAAKAGLARGDVIIQVGSQPVRNLRDAAAALRTTVAGERVVVLIVRQNYRAYTRVTLER